MKQTVVQKPELSNLSVEGVDTNLSQILTKPATVEADTREIARRDYYEYVCYVHEVDTRKHRIVSFVGRHFRKAIDKKKQ